MKLIENTIDVDQLQTPIRNTDLEDNMPTCDLETMNVEQSKKETSSEKTVVDKEEKIPKQSNGIRNTPSKTNGFFDDPCDDDYHLVLESSSEDGESPKKNLFDDATISAPQIVQEIEDLLGIDASNGIDEELEKDLIILDDSEKDDIADESNLLSGAFPQELHDASDREEDFHEKTHLSVPPNNEKNGKDSEINKCSDDIECDSSSNMNLVYDEVEIGTENVVISNLEGLAERTRDISESTSELPVKTCTSRSSAAENEAPTSKETEEKSIDVSKRANKFEENSADVNGENEVCSGSTNPSFGSDDWMVLDSVESEEEGRMSQEKSNSSQDDSSKLEDKGSNTDISADAKSTESLTDHSVTAGVHRKRTASVEQLNSDGKKPKLEEETLVTHKENDLSQSCSQVLKRLTSDPIEVEPKRSKFSEPTVDNNKTPKQEFFNKKKAIESNKDENDKDENCVQNDFKISSEDNNDTNIKNESKNCVKNNLKNSFEDKKDKDMENKDCLQNTSKDNKDDDIKKIDSEVNKSVDVKNKIENLVQKSSLENSDQIVLDQKLAKRDDEDINNVSTVVSKEEEKVNNLSSNIAEDDLDKLNTAKDESSLKITEKDPTLKVIEQEDDALNKRGCLQQSENDGVESCELASKNTKTPSETMEDADSTTINTNLIKNKHSDGEVETTEEKSDENKENVQNSSCSKETSSNEPSLTLDTLSNSRVLDKKENTLIEGGEDKCKPCAEPKSLAGLNNPINIDDDIIATEVISTPTVASKSTTSISKGTKTKHNGQFGRERLKPIKSPFELLNKNLAEQNELKQLTNLDKSIESVVAKVRSGKNMNLPILKKFHQSQLRRLTRSQLEETVVLKICEAITDRSDIGQMRLRCQSLEQSNELWKKKAAQFEKQNRELEMVLKRFLSEVTHLKKENQNKVVLPIKVTRSVGLQVVLASSVHGALVPSKNKATTESSRKESNKTLIQPQRNSPVLIRPKAANKERVQEPQKIKTNLPPAQPATTTKSLRGRPARLPQTPSPSSSSNIAPASTPTKITLANSPVKPVATKTISTPTKDLEVIDLTDREEKAKSSPTQVSPVSGTIRVTPSTQVCFVQPSSSNTSTAPMAYIVQKAGQRQQYLVAATSSPSPPRPAGTNSRQPPALALPVFRAGGQLIPVQTSTTGGIRTSTSTVVAAPRPLPQAIRLQTNVSMLKHPAPLPSAPPQAMRPGIKAPPPKPQLKIAKTVNGIMLSWSMTLTKDLADMSSYQLYAYQEGMQPPSTNLWKKVGDVKALPLPMACTLTQFIEGHKYHFAVRAVDVHGRIGPFSQPSTILLSK